MTMQQIISTVFESNLKGQKVIYGHNGCQIYIYPRSIRMSENELFFIGREKHQKFLYLITESGKTVKNDQFKGTLLPREIFGYNLNALQIEMNHYNAKLLMGVFPFTQPTLIGKVDSFGFGDRLGIANAAHIRALEGSHLKPILAQQSIRELERTKRTPEEVIDAAVWAVFQEGYTQGYGADADHLKTTADIDLMIKAGFKMFTFDPSAYVLDDALHFTKEQLIEHARKIQKNEFSLENVFNRYLNRSFNLDDGTVLQPSEEEIMCAFVKYGEVLTYTEQLYRYLKDKYSSIPTEVELSIDETEVPTSPFEHYFIVNELTQMGIQLVSLAPRFIGDFEKGIDYKGSIKDFIFEYRQHVSISKIFGNYKISIHSGSDKFSIYNAIGKLKLGNVHVKTAGTSYLEALRTIAMVEPNLIREILDFARENFNEQRKSYFVSAELNKVPESKECTDLELVDLFNQDDARQVFHVTFGKTLTVQNQDGTYRFRDRLKKCLEQNEELHYENLIKHFKKHIEPFKK